MNVCKYKHLYSMYDEFPSKNEICKHITGFLMT